ncbi:hypothetical protein LBMAG42_15310 [Deltaproteobacteria bacterium]|nr:hypothetical protein LBMAG42_15310 [Deltaproteobacteria bacterium]
MNVVVRYFARLRELKGCSEESCTFPAAITAAAAYAALGLPAELPIAFAVNQERVSGDTLLREGDELVFLPPIGGG